MRFEPLQQMPKDNLIFGWNRIKSQANLSDYGLSNKISPLEYDPIAWMNAGNSSFYTTSIVARYAGEKVCWMVTIIRQRKHHVMQWRGSLVTPTTIRLIDNYQFMKNIEMVTIIIKTNSSLIIFGRRLIFFSFQGIQLSTTQSNNTMR